MTTAEVIANVAKEIGATKKEVIEALQYSCVTDEIKGQVEFLRTEK